MYREINTAAPVLPYFEYFRWDGKVDQLPSTLRKILGADGYQALQARVRWLKHERKAHTGLPFTRKLEMWRRGFFAESAVIYDFPANDPRWYVTDYQHFCMGQRVNGWEGLYDHKLSLRALLLAKGLRQADTVAYIYEGKILVQPFSGGARYIEARELIDLLREEGEEASWIVKPEDGLRGEGLFMLRYESGEFWVQRGRQVQEFDLEKFLEGLHPGMRGNAGAMLIERRLEQGAFWRSLFPESANTLRLQTLWIPGEPEPFVARAVQRIGTVDTVPTDNWSGGGISSPVQLETGRLGAGRIHPLKAPPERRGRLFTDHPDTGARIADVVLPHWERVTEVVLRAAASVPFNLLAGWDVLVDAEGVPVILEANGNSDVNLLQVHGGLLAEPRIQQFYRAVGVV
ncbi:MAG TPA: sugar-transfer associated ATP-grasp domain-containing protein [Gemmatimonadales bacterium]|nr:sugar-transfer associated ATP-grasp domain-containing protein [Gemmatimonadales bacterium]